MVVRQQKLGSMGACEMSVEFWVQMMVYALSMGTSVGVILTKIGYLEKKVDALTGFAERVTRAEQKTKAAHYRIDELTRVRIKEKKAR